MKKHLFSVTQVLEITRKALQATEIKLSEEFFNALEVYLKQLIRFSSAYNITGFKSAEAMAEKAVVDSLLYLEFIPEGPCTVLDIGSGAGLPGLIMKMARPELSVTLLEPSRKKITFLEFVINKLGLSAGIRPLQLTLEAFARTGESFRVITTRALFSAEALLKKAAPFITGGTRIILSKGPAVHEEISALEQEGLRYQIHTRALPLSKVQRHFLVIDM